MPDFASNETFVGPLPEPSDQYEGQPTKVAMTEAQRANGFVPDQPIAAEHLNAELHAISADVAELQSRQAPDLPYEPSDPAAWQDPDPVHVAAGLDALAALTGRLLAFTVRTSGSGTHIYHPRCTFRIVEIQAGGGGSGGVRGAVSATRVSAGGQAGGFRRVAGPPGNGAYAVGAAGAQGSLSSPDGGHGGNSSFESTTVTGGRGSPGVSSGGTTRALLIAQSVGGYIGALGVPAINLSGFGGPAMSGQGGSTRYGAGGPPRELPAGHAGAFDSGGSLPAPTHYGAGAGGAIVHDSNDFRPGAPGVEGTLVIWEF